MSCETTYTYRCDVCGNVIEGYVYTNNSIGFNSSAGGSSIVRNWQHLCENHFKAIHDCVDSIINNYPVKDTRGVKDSK